MKTVLTILVCAVVALIGTTCADAWPDHGFTFGWVGGIASFIAMGVVDTLYEIRDIVRAERDESLNKLY
jgi:hypothetical protein